MDISQEIFEVFFKKLDDDKEFPEEIIESLKKLWLSGDFISQDNLLILINKGITDVHNN